MAFRNRELNKQPGSSLLLSPPGFSYINVEGSALLVPVSESNVVTSTVPTTEGYQAPQFEEEFAAPPPPIPPTQEPNFYNPNFVTSTTSPFVNDVPMPPPPQQQQQQQQFQPQLQSHLQQVSYRPVQPHWFYCRKVEKKEVWIPFSLVDSVHLEEEFSKKNGQDVVATDGGRYDVLLNDRLRCAVYWEEAATVVRRATWFFRRDGERAFIPYPEHFAEKLEEEYSVAVKTNTWHRRLEFPDGETVVIHNPTVIVHYQPNETEKWEGGPETGVKPCVVKRGMDDYEVVEDGETMQIDHLVFFVHGIGAICDLKFRTLPEVVNDFRSISTTLLKTHFHKHFEDGRIGRVEFLPISWHNFLHGEATGIDDKLKPITLKSIPKLRYFANDAILDVLFYTSPLYCQAIINQVVSELNRLYELFLSRNPTFQGRVSLAGHSLGSVILFDLLLHQADVLSQSLTDESSILPVIDSVYSSKEVSPLNERTDSTQSSIETISNLEDCMRHLGLEEYLENFEREKMDMETLVLCDENDIKDMGIPLGPRKKLLSFLQKRKQELEQQHKEPQITNIPEQPETTPGPQRKKSEATINYIIGLAGTGHPYVRYPRINFDPTSFFALGSPVAMFLTVRGVETEYENFRFPNCPAFFNIFHPFDPVAYRIEPLIDPRINLKPVLIPHHKGRKRLHLEIKESLTRMGNDLKQKLIESLRNTWSTIHYFAAAHRSSAAQVEAEVDKVVEEELKASAVANDDDALSTISSNDIREEDVAIGQLNGGRRIDYVLQEKPIESFNEYLFALGSHACYWESEDTVLLMLKEIYAGYGIHPSFQTLELYVKPPARHPQPNPMSQQQPFALRNVLPDRRWPSPSPPPPPPPQNPGFNRPPDTSVFQPSGNSTDNRFSRTQPMDFPQYPMSAMTPPPPAALGHDPTIRPTNSVPCGPPPLTGFVKQSVIKK